MARTVGVNGEPKQGHQRSSWQVAVGSSAGSVRVTNVSQVSPSLASPRLLVFQPISHRAREVLKKGGFEEPSRSSSMEQFERGETRRRAPM